ncbi:hypothetical protein CYY_005699 [Polysphondylium violaceum]|uniref:Ribosomal protein L22 n=1 Tax=Polysphondylium violaceum TaxID=133409 RepID=A0A8J4PT37_9MYCE|nr:hypothetical protein CYY_005699 [Polysphondylium violaceum]
MMNQLTKSLRVILNVSSKSANTLSTPSYIYRSAVALNSNTSSSLSSITGHKQLYNYYSTAKPVTGTTSSTSNIFSQSFSAEQPAAAEQQQSGSTKPKTVILSLKNIQYSQWKLQALFKALRGLSYQEAIAQLTFCKKGPAKQIRGLVTQARYVAEYQRDMNPDRLVLNQIWLGRSFFTPSVMVAGRGHMTVLRKPFCHVTVELIEAPVVEGEKKLGKFGKTHKTHAKYNGTFQYNKKY